MSTVTPHKSLTVNDVTELGSFLIKMADCYPYRLRVEEDFFPVVHAFLHGRVPSVKGEVGPSAKKIDFRTGGNNPGLLEIAVGPRELKDAHHSGMVFPGTQHVQLYGSQNKSELLKLAGVSQSRAKNRYLLLVDLGKPHDPDKLERTYLRALPKGRGHAAVRVVYVTRDHATDFGVGGK